MYLSPFSLLTLLNLASSHAYGAVIPQRKSPYLPVPFQLGRRVTAGAYTITADDSNQTQRLEAINATRAGFLYGPAVGGGPFYPAGPVGNLTASEDSAALDADEEAEDFGDLSTLESYVQLYDNEWTHSLPNGPAPGILTNYTQDLVFSMERLANSPFAVRRLNPSSDSLPFQVEDSIAQNVSGLTLESLFSAGRLFYVDHTDIGTLPTNGRYTAATDAYFVIDATSGDFLPLAIRTGVGADLIYTPTDKADDWLLAKIMFNANDLFFAQFNHLAATHMVVQITWMAAIRSLSTEHPVYAIFDRLAYETFGIQPIAAAMLFAPGAAIDEIFPVSGTTAQNYASDLYFNGKGNFQANYFLTDLQNRGLINSTIGPELTHFPFYEDAAVIYNAVETFMTTFVDSYYTTDSAVAADTELQNWAEEANGPAEAMGFPTTISDKATLKDQNKTESMLISLINTQAHLVTSAHHSVNTNQLESLSLTLPFHPAALYAPIPTTKGNTSVVSFLPPFEQSDAQIFVSAGFSRPLLAGTNRSLLHMFDDESMLNLMNEETAEAAATFKSTMQAFSDVVAARTFDAEGLCQGMPFVWQALDPNVAPYSSAI
ncbi:manganese lipoxygenase [Cryphonectria parasitica EP155]|uniref:Manganese lipoxygenase n=1 Tax=Cryphonectria parasitica (strain ATCC 38755 / EP155) TaxID=660469 RepID=A0A9P5CN08_CRYP1|nr:manganese lipoxygenase [Cryphonectria parasitica EP155]KAF3763817.1 manganese lipoxygenase [Cryphonectria parasitica EP155]